MVTHVSPCLPESQAVLSAPGLGGCLICSPRDCGRAGSSPNALLHQSHLSAPHASAACPGSGVCGTPVSAGHHANRGTSVPYPAQSRLDGAWGGLSVGTPSRLVARGCRACSIPITHRHGAEGIPCGGCSVSTRSYPTQPAQPHSLSVTGDCHVGLAGWCPPKQAWGSTEPCINVGAQMGAQISHPGGHYRSLGTVTLLGCEFCCPSQIPTVVS